jgi:hypothetical protein
MQSGALATSGGAHALRGFEYQGIVVLDVLLAAFDGSKPVVCARAEGEDDLVIRFGAGDGQDTTQFYEIKKPREASAGSSTRRAWSLSEAARELLPQSIELLRDPRARQTWVLGDEVGQDLRRLIDGGERAPEVSRHEYRTALFLLARDRSRVLHGLNSSAHRRLSRWRPTAGSRRSVAPVDAENTVASVAAWLEKLRRARVARALRQAFKDQVAVLHKVLPGALARIELRTTYGSENEVAERVRVELQRRYGLSPNVVAHTLLRNLRGFVNEVSTEPGRWIDSEELDYQLRCVWPEMSPVRVPPVLSAHQIRRPRLVGDIVAAAAIGPVAVVGISGSGKTTLPASCPPQCFSAYFSVACRRAQVHETGRKTGVARDSPPLLDASFGNLLPLEEELGKAAVGGGPARAFSCPSVVHFTPAAAA